MVILKEKNRFYFIESCWLYSSMYDMRDLYLEPENLPIFKAERSNVLIGGDMIDALDTIRYVNLHFPAKLNFSSLCNSGVNQRIHNALKSVGKEGEEPIFVFAKDDKAFELDSTGAFLEIESCYTLGSYQSFFNYALAVSEDLPFEKRIKTIYKIVGDCINTNLFPVVMMDSKNFKLTIIEEDKA